MKGTYGWLSWMALASGHLIFESKGWSPVSTTKAINEKNFKQWVFSNLVKMLLGAVYTLIMVFNLILTLRCRKADIVATVSSPVSLSPAENYRQCFSCKPFIIAGVFVTGNK
jgi:hypothetical protein